MARHEIEPFLLYVVDQDQGEFTVEGPMTDDTSWINAVVAAQNAGRKVTCSTVGRGLTKEMAAERRQASCGGRLVSCGSIVSPLPN
jgi:hypothetical protein